MYETYDKEVKPLLEIFDQVREIATFNFVELPKIVVVGDQSSGKSSVLESITGINLPRGENTVTRCPFVLQLRNVDSKNDEKASVRISHETQDKALVCSLEDLTEAIHNKQDLLLSSSKKQIVNTPIYIKVHKTGIPDLTVYDLPGRTYKNDELTSEVKNIISEYTKETNTLILLVLAANTDLSTSEAISLIRKKDKFRERTIPVITKIDLIVNDKNIKKKILNNELGLKFKPIVVRNRNLEELENNTDGFTVKSREEQLFLDHPELSDLPDVCKGTKSLIKTVVSQQKQKLLESRFEIQDKFTNELIKSEELMKTFAPPSESVTEKQDRFKDFLDSFIKQFETIIKGGVLENDSVFGDEKSTFVKTFRDYLTNFRKEFTNHQNYFLESDYRTKVIKAINETRGFKLPTFFDPDSFHQLMSREIDSKTKNSVVVLISKCKELLKDIFARLIKESGSSYPQLIQAIKGEINRLVDEKSKYTDIYLKQLIDAEKNLEWSSNPAYVDIVKKINNSISDRKLKNQPTVTTPPNTTQNTFNQQQQGINFQSQQTQNKNIFGGGNYGLFGNKSIQNQQNNSGLFSNSSTLMSNTNDTINFKAEDNNVLSEDKENNFDFTYINDFRIPNSVIFSPIMMSEEKDNTTNSLQIYSFAYWKVFTNSFVDTCQKIVFSNLIYYFKNDLRNYLDKKFSPNSSSINMDLICEDTQVAFERQELKEKIKNIEHALNLINSIC